MYYATSCVHRYHILAASSAYCFKRWLTHLCVITEHAKFKLLSWHYKLGAATSATGVL